MSYNYMTEGRILNIEESRDRENDWTWEDLADSPVGVGTTAGPVTVTAEEKPKPIGVDYRRYTPVWYTEEEYEASKSCVGIGTSTEESCMPADWADAGEYGWYAEVDDQGSTGSCVGHAVGDVVRHALVKAKKIRASASEKPSYRHIWQASKESDVFTKNESTFLLAEGTSIKDALNICRNRGTVPDPVLPMDSPGSYMRARSFYILAAQNKISGYFATAPFTGGYGYKGYKWWLENHGPMVTRLNVTKAFFGADKTNSIFDEYDYKARVYGAHAIVVCGYKQINGELYYLVKNSWGKEWGDDGFIWVSETYAKQAFTESYGVKA